MSNLSIKDMQLLNRYAEIALPVIIANVVKTTVEAAAHDAINRDLLEQLFDPNGWARLTWKVAEAMLAERNKTNAYTP